MDKIIFLYPTEKISIENKAIVKLEVGKFSLDFFVYIAEIKNNYNYILEVDFLE